VRVEVTAGHIARGRPKDAACCAAALALSDAMGEPWEVYGEDAGPATGVADWIYLPPEAVRFVDDFDAGRPVEPFAFEVERETSA
jgi:hypothetical protein